MTIHHNVQVELIFIVFGSMYVRKTNIQNIISAQHVFLICIQYTNVCFTLNHFEDEDHGLNLSEIKNIITLSEI